MSQTSPSPPAEPGLSDADPHGAQPDQDGPAPGTADAQRLTEELTELTALHERLAARLSAADG